MHLKTIVFISFILSFFLQIYCQYPEDFSSIEQLTYLDATSEEEEIYLGSYYHDQSTTPLVFNDYHNGVRLYPKSFSNLPTDSCTILTTSYNENDDKPWDIENYGNIYYPPTYTLTNEQCIQSENIVLNLDLTNFLSDDIISLGNLYGLSYIFYFWIEKNDNNDIQFYCNGSTDKMITFLSLHIGLYQFYLKYDNSETFSANGDSFTCSSKEIAIKNSAGSQIYFHRLKLGLLINKEKISSTNCNNDPYLGKCPYSYYCDTYSGECKKCLGKFSQCKNSNTGISCSPFTQEWDKVGTTQESCTSDYFNLQYLDEMTYDINPPIKSNAASISFWLFTTKDINAKDDPKIYHITLEDFFVVTIIPGKDEYIIYATAYEMYHKAIGTVLKDITTKKDFEKVKDTYFPYQNWYISKI